MRHPTESTKRRSRLPLPPDRQPPFLFLAGGGRSVLVTPWARGTRLSDQQRAEVEAVRARVAAGCRAGPMAAWIGSERITEFRPQSSSWIQTKLAHHLVLHLVLPAT
jgi:hypothetical protein